MLACANCGAKNREGAKFCSECGAALMLSCPACGAPNEAGAKFCNECGTPLTDGLILAPASAAPSTPASPPAVEPMAERRLVSVLFADLVGFTSLSESRDAEEVRELLSRYFDTCRRLVGLYGGAVEKFIGDAVMAVWGTPVATEDDAERAVRTALDLVAAVQALGQEVGAEDLRARAGVLTGEAAVNMGAVGEGMVAGDLVNTASRVQSVAEPGSVFVGEATRRATEGTVVYEAAGSFELKGKEGETPLWRASRVVSGRGGSLKSEGLEAPFVGRDRELRQIKDLFHVCAEEGRAQLVSVTGIAGIGKSRLAWEFYKYFDGIAQSVYWHRGRCLAYGEGVTYWALADMVRWRCGIAEDDPQEDALEKLQAALQEHLLDPEEGRFVEPRLAQLLALGEGSSHERQDLFAAWRLFFERLADTYPTILAFEDMQWADSSLLDFVEYLLEWSRDKPLFVVTMARPELLEKRPNWGAGHRNFTSLYLEPLSEQAMQELLTGLVPGLPPSLRSQILDRAEGVPLYAVETVRMLLDRGLLVEDGSAYQVVGEIETLEVPETLHALIAARLDGLSPDERRLLGDAAVLGKTFTTQALAALSGFEPERLEELLTGLVRREVLGLQSDPRSPEQGQYTFLQDLLRHVAYETLSKRERKVRHLAAAEHLATAFADVEEVAEILASHYLSAYEAAPEAEDAQQIRGEARQMLAEAGERAMSLAAAAEAQRYFEQAAGLAEEPREEGKLRERAGEAAFTAGNGSQAQAHFLQAMRLFETAGEPHIAARVSARLGRVEQGLGQLDQAVQRLEEAFAVLAVDEPDADFARLAVALGGLQFFKGNTQLAGERLQTALDLAEALWLPDVLAETLMALGQLSVHTRRPEYALALYRHALALARDHELAEQTLKAYINLADLALQRDRYEEAVALYEEGLPLARHAGDRRIEGLLACDSIYALSMTGQWEEALARSTELPPTELLGSFELSMVVGLGLIQAARGNLDEARRLFSSAARLEDSDDVQVRTGYAAARAFVLRLEGQFEDALESAEEALAGLEVLGYGHQDIKLAVSEALEAAISLRDDLKIEQILGQIDSLREGELPPLLAAEAARFHARLSATRKQYERAESGFRTAIELFRQLGTPFHLAVAELEHAEWRMARGRPDNARPLLAEARETFERLDAKPWLERLNATEAGIGAQTVA
jgi:predicted ATPase/class 3 adenylate cyclase